MERITHQTLRKICFPIYKLDKPNIQEKDGVVWSVSPTGIYSAIDDKNQEGPFWKRRLVSPQKLHKLHKSISSIPELLHNGKFFVDSNGMVFRYIKTEFTFTKCLKIIRQDLKETYTLLRLEKVNFPFIVQRPVNLHWARVIFRKECPWLIEEFLEKPEKDTKRKI